MSRDSKAEESEEPPEELNETVDANEELDENLLDCGLSRVITSHSICYIFVQYSLGVERKSMF